MGLMPEGTGNPFTRLDRQTVIGILKATGSRDPDVLHAQKERLLAQPKHLKLLAILLVGIGGFLTITVFAAIAGIPAMLFGWWVWRFSARNIEAVESGFAEFAGSTAV